MGEFLFWNIFKFQAAGQCSRNILKRWKMVPVKGSISVLFVEKGMGRKFTPWIILRVFISQELLNINANIVPWSFQEGTWCICISIKCIKERNIRIEKICIKICLNKFSKNSKCLFFFCLIYKPKIAHSTLFFSFEHWTWRCWPTNRISYSEAHWRGLCLYCMWIH